MASAASVDLRRLLVDAADALHDAATVGGAPRTYESVEADVRAVITAIDATASDLPSAPTNPNPGIDQRGIDKDFPLLYEMAQQYDFAERLGGSNAPVLEEADRALRELWMARGGAS